LWDGVFGCSRHAQSVSSDAEECVLVNFQLALFTRCSNVPVAPYRDRCINIFKGLSIGFGKTIFHVLIGCDREGHYAASVPALWGCHSEAKYLNELFKLVVRSREASQLCLEAKGKGLESLDSGGVQQVSIAI
jgi:predicted RNase H-like HicB family nuclease